MLDLNEHKDFYEEANDSLFTAPCSSCRNRYSRIDTPNCKYLYCIHFYSPSDSNKEGVQNVQ